jgi:hypothetical protein
MAMARHKETVRVTVEYTVTYATDQDRTEALVQLYRCPFGLNAGSWSVQREDVVSVVPASDA